MFLREFHKLTSHNPDAILQYLEDKAKPNIAHEQFGVPIYSDEHRLQIASCRDKNPVNVDTAQAASSLSKHLGVCSGCWDKSDNIKNTHVPWTPGRVNSRFLTVPQTQTRVEKAKQSCICNNIWLDVI